MKPLLLTAGWRLVLIAFLTLALLGLPVPVRADDRLPATSGWPLAGTPRVTREFDPPLTRWGPGHRGVDLAARPGQSVLAASSGVVSFAGSVAGKGVVTIDHGGGLSTTYESIRPRVSVGAAVATGDVIGVIRGGTHCGSCLHWGLRLGKTYLDPLTLVRRRDGSLRLVSSSRRGAVQREAAARALAEAAAESMGIVGAPAGTPGAHGFARPVPGAITSPFGRRFHPVLHIWKLHDGTDFGASCGTPIRAPYDGRVSRTYFNPGYGNRLLLDHGRVDGHEVVTAYNHATGYVVRGGDQVRRGQVIGHVGSTGYSTGCHLHLMVWLDGGLADPMSWF
ncbi:MAG TPA: peptidoglycan DD-metalloendopeptidase family protein [Propionibacteriaceae bacterium]